MRKDEIIRKMAEFIEELSGLTYDVVMFRYAHGYSNKEIASLLELPEDLVAKKALCGVIMLSVRFERSENFLFPDNLLYPAAELALEKLGKTAARGRRIF